jgi:hypothetical protein
MNSKAGGRGRATLTYDGMLHAFGSRLVSNNALCGRRAPGLRVLWELPTHNTYTHGAMTPAGAFALH